MRRSFGMRNVGRFFAGACIAGLAGVLPQGSLWGQEILISNGDFQTGSEGWTLTPGYSIEKGSGCNGTVALAYSNSDPEFP